ncbi:MAG: HDIG domain-containing protein [Anaerolineales bacterium]|nr:HDIG domain-containing protein [Anaerolineales bacterium]
MLNKIFNPTLRHRLALITLLIISSVVAFAVLLTSITSPPAATDLQVGDVAAEDILAPYAISYTSQVLTEQQRQSAASNVELRYTSPDTSTARQQLDRLRAALAYISSVRADLYASLDQKLADLAALRDIQLDQETATGLLELNDTRWQAVQQESSVVLERVMRNTIREDQLDETRRSIPNLVSLTLPEDQAELVAELVSAFIIPNSFYSESLTELARQQAADAISPVTINYATGERVIERGEVITSVKLEALQSLGLAEPEIRWQDQAGVFILVLVAVSLVIIYLRHKPILCQDLRALTLLLALFLLFFIGARLALPLHPSLAYIYPIGAYALVVAALFKAEVALVTVIPLILMSTYGHPAMLELLLYYSVSSILGVLIPKREQRITAYIWSGITIAASGAATLSAYLLPQSEVEWSSLAPLAALSLLNGSIVSGLTVLLHYVLSPLMGQITPLQLLELSRPDNPLLEYLLRNAPGTYQHSLQVANLAEQAAERIGADSLLTRVGALYHDIGKTENPQFFIENQAPGQIDTHDNLDALESATIIIRHVSDGLKLARQHRLPRRIQDFIAEHHGTMTTAYQYNQAIKAAGGDGGQIDEKLFKYPGPAPQSRETALLMLADGCEARVRAQRPKNEEDLRSMIKNTIDNRVAAGQLDHTNLTLEDLKVIVESYTATLRGIYHPRIEYPSIDIPTRPISQMVETTDVPLESPSQENEPEAPPPENSNDHPGN